jgi:chitin disaccharide deacetylase
MKLIVSADDYGTSPEVNRAIIRAHQEGVLTSCSLMVNGAAFTEAVKLAQSFPQLAVGLHLTTVAGKPTLPAEQIPALVEKDGNFSRHATSAGLNYFFSRPARQQLHREIAAQFEKFSGTGLPFAHVDGHLHHHVHPVIFNEVIGQSKRYGVRAIRVPMDDLPLAIKFDSRQQFLKIVYWSVFSLLGSRMKRHARRAGLRFADRVYGFFQTGRMDRDYFLQVMRHLDKPLNEVYFHPADFGSSLDPTQRQAGIELQALLDPEVKKEIARRGIQLVNYRQLGDGF